MNTKGPATATAGVVGIHHVAAFDLDVFNLVGRVDAIELDGAGLHVLEFGLHVGRAFAGLDVVSLQHHLELAFPADEHVLGEFSGFDHNGSVGESTAEMEPQMNIDEC